MEEDIFVPRVVNMHPIVLKWAFVIIPALFWSGSLQAQSKPFVLPDTLSYPAWMGLNEAEQQQYLEQWNEQMNSCIVQLEQQLELEINQFREQGELRKSTFLRKKSSALDSLEHVFLIQFEALSGQEEQSFFKEKKFQARDALQADYDLAKDRFQAEWAVKEAAMLDKLHQLSASNTQILSEMLNKNLTWLEGYRNRLISTQKHQ